MIQLLLRGGGTEGLEFKLIKQMCIWVATHAYAHMGSGAGLNFQSLHVTTGMDTVPDAIT